MISAQKFNLKISDGKEVDEAENIQPKKALETSEVLKKRKSSVLEKINPRSLFFHFLFSFRFVRSDIKKSPHNFCLGILSLIVVASVISLFFTIIVNSQMVFLRITERQVGELDVLFTSRNGLLNQTYLEELLQNNKHVESTTPRFLLRGKFRNIMSGGELVSVYLLFIDSVFEESMSIGRSFRGRVLGATEHHAEMTVVSLSGLSAHRGERSYIHVDLPFGSYTSEIREEFEEEIASFRKGLKERIPFFEDVLSVSGINLTTIMDSMLNDISLPIVLELTLIDEISTPGGKYPGALGNVVVADISSLEAMIQQLYQLSNSLFLDPGGGGVKVPQNIGGLISGGRRADTDDDVRVRMNIRRAQEDPTSFNIREYSMMSIGKLKNRKKIYTLPAKERRQAFIDLSNAMADVFGGSDGLGNEGGIIFRFPIADSLSSYDYVRFFLEQVLTEAMVIICVVSTIVLTNLFLLNQKLKIFQFGILRSIGFRKTGFFSLYFFNSMMISLPSTLIVLVLSYFLNFFSQWILNELLIKEKRTIYEFLSDIHYGAILCVLIVTFGIPLLANIIPVYNSLGQNLLESLNPLKSSMVGEKSKHKIKDVKKKLSKFYGLKASHLAFAICSIVLGFILFYLVPLTFIFQELSLFFYIMEGIFLFMIFCFSLLSQIIQPYVEWVLLHILLLGHKVFKFCLSHCSRGFPDLGFFCFRKKGKEKKKKKKIKKTLIRNNTKALRVLLKKNLSAHRPQNRKTFLVCLVCITLIVFAGVGIEMYSLTIKSTAIMLIGSDFLVEAETVHGPLFTEELTEFLENSPVVSSFSFVSFPWNEMGGPVGSTKVSTLSNYPFVYNEVYGISQNYLHTCGRNLDEFYVPTELNYGLRLHLSQNKKNKKKLEEDMIGGKFDVLNSLYEHTPGIVKAKDFRSAHFIPSSVLSNICRRSRQGEEEDGLTSTTTFECTNDLEDKINREKYTNIVEIVTTENQRNSIGVTADSPVLFTLGLNKNCFGLSKSDPFNCSEILLGIPHGTVRRIPGYYISTSMLVEDLAPIFVSFPQMRKLLEFSHNIKCPVGLNNQDSPTLNTCGADLNIKMKKCLIRLKDDLVDDASGDGNNIEIDKFVNELKVHIDSNNHFVMNLHSILGTIDTAVVSFQSFFYAIGVISFFFITMMLSINFYSNVLRDSYVTGVLRAIGYSVDQLVVLYGCEALILLCCSFICGLVLGSVSGVVMVLQLNMFLEMPFHFKFPYSLIAVLFVCMFLCAFFGTLIPISRIKKESISKLLKG